MNCSRRGTCTPLAAVLVALSIAAAACGSEGNDTANEATATGAPAPTSGTPTTGGAGTEEQRFAPQPMAEPAEMVMSLPIRLDNFASFLLAESTGEFAKENLTVKFEEIPSSDALPLLAAGEIDAIPTSFNASIINAIASGIDIRAVMDLGGNPPKTQGIYVLNDVLAQGPQALVGQDIGSAIGPGSIGSLYLNDWLKTGGASIADVNFVRFPAADIAQAMRNGALKAAFLTSPSHLQVQDIATFVGGPPADFAGGPVWFGKRIRVDNPEIGEAFIRAVARTVITYLQGDYKSDPEVLALLAEALGTDAEVIASSGNFDFVHGLEPLKVEPVMAMQEVWLLEPDVMKVDKPLPIEQIVDSSLLKAVVAAG